MYAVARGRGRSRGRDGAEDPGRDRADGRGEPDRPSGAGGGGPDDRPGGDVAGARPPRRADHPRRRRGPGLPELPGLSGDVVHLGQRRHRARHPQATSRCARGTSSGSTAVSSTRGTTATRRAPSRWARSTPEAQRLLEVTEEALRLRGRAGAAGRAPLGHRARGAEPRREPRLLGGARVLGHGIGTSLHEDPQVPELRRAGQGAEAEARHGAGDRADGQRRQEPGSGWTPTAGRRGPRTDRCRRISSTRWRSPRRGARVLGTDRI